MARYEYQREGKAWSCHFSSFPNSDNLEAAA